MALLYASQALDAVKEKLDNFDQKVGLLPDDLHTFVTCCMHLNSVAKRCVPYNSDSWHVDRDKAKQWASPALMGVPFIE